jgi:hypothetical protein
MWQTVNAEARITGLPPPPLPLLIISELTPISYNTDPEHCRLLKDQNPLRKNPQKNFSILIICGGSPEQREPPCSRGSSGALSASLSTYLKGYKYTVPY